MDYFAIMPIEVFMDDRLSKTEIRVLGAILSWRKSDTNLRWPTRDQISERTNLPVCKISTATTSLVKLGWLKKEGNGGKSTPSKYYLTVPDIAKKVTDSVTVSQPKKVTDSVTLTDSVTVTDSVTQTVTDSVTQTVTDSVRGNINKTKQKEINNFSVLSAGAREAFPDVPTSAMQWAEFFVSFCGFKIHEAQTAKSIPLFANWVSRGISTADVQVAVIAGNSWRIAQGETGPPNSPSLYAKFLETVLAEKEKLKNAKPNIKKTAPPQVNSGFAEKYAGLG